MRIYMGVREIELTHFASGTNLRKQWWTFIDFETNFPTMIIGTSDTTYRAPGHLDKGEDVLINCRLQLDTTSAVPCEPPRVSFIGALSTIKFANPNEAKLIIAKYTLFSCGESIRKIHAWVIELHGAHGPHSGLAENPDPNWIQVVDATSGDVIYSANKPCHQVFPDTLPPKLDLSDLGWPTTLQKVVEQNAPLAVITSLHSRCSPGQSGFFQYKFLKSWGEHVDSTIALVYMVDTNLNGYCQLYNSVMGEYHLIGTVSDLNASSLTHFEFRDFDCDGRNEVLLSSPSGMGAWTMYHVIKVSDSGVVNVSDMWFEGPLWGRTIEFVRDSSDCATLVIIKVDDRYDHTPTIRSTYRLDPANPPWKLISRDSL